MSRGGTARHRPQRGRRQPARAAGDPQGAERGRGGGAARCRAGRRAAATARSGDPRTLYAGGLRIGELVGLDLGDLDLHGGMVRVLGKWNKERVVPLGRSARGALTEYLDDGRIQLDRARSRVDRSALFLNARGGRLTRQGAWGIVRGAGDRAGLRGRLYPHVLRHSCATHMLDHGADIRVVQELLGHASLSTTQVYTKVSPERLRAVYESAHPRAHAR
ncbi:MAG: tyrosine-type recombinase/integrase [Acidimicrobiia bacterium]